MSYSTATKRRLLTPRHCSSIANSSSIDFSISHKSKETLELLSGGLCPKGYFHEGLQSELAIDEIEIY